MPWIGFCVRVKGENQSSCLDLNWRHNFIRLILVFWRGGLVSFVFYVLL